MELGRSGKAGAPVVVIVAGEGGAGVVGEGRRGATDWELGRSQGFGGGAAGMAWRFPLRRSVEVEREHGETKVV